MSLDVYLTGPEREVECHCECGHCHTKTTRDQYYEANITHNLGRMATSAGIYKPLWRPDEIGITKASQLIAPLTDGLELLESDESQFMADNASNGWGRYEHFVPWVREYLNACKKYPDADVSVSR